MKLKKYLIYILGIAVLMFSIKPLIFTYYVKMAGMYRYDDVEKAAGYMYGAVRIKPSSYKIFKQYSHPHLDHRIIKGAIIHKYRDNENIFQDIDSPALSRERFRIMYRDNFYLYYLFSSRGASRKRGQWENLDAVSLELLGNPGINPLTLEIFKNLDMTFSPGFADGLADYCQWQGNPEMSIHVRNTYGAAARTFEPGLEAPQSLQRVVGFLGGRFGVAAQDLDNNLIIDPGFDNAPLVKNNWRPSLMAGRPPFADGSFTMGRETLTKNPCLRVMGFYIQPPSGEKIPVRGGAWYRFKIPVQKGVYLFSFDYQTVTGGERVSYYLWKRLGEHYIPETNGQWRTALYVLNNADGKHTIIKPLVRMWGTGTLRVDNVRLMRFNKRPERLLEKMTSEARNWVLPVPRPQKKQHKEGREQ